MIQEQMKGECKKRMLFIKMKLNSLKRLDSRVRLNMAARWVWEENWKNFRQNPESRLVLHTDGHRSPQLTETRPDRTDDSGRD